MNWLSKIVGGSIGSVVEQVGNVVDKFHLSGEEKQRFKLEMEALLQRRYSEIEDTIRVEMQAKQQILTAELTQGDSYTKRARPTVVYAGLGFIFFNYCLVPVISKLAGMPIDPLELPTAFWAGWSGIVATWSVGRTLEKRGAGNRITQAITGSSDSHQLLDDISAQG